MSATEPDDRVLAVTRVVAVVIVPFLAVAAFLLFVFPDRTGELFAWPISPPLSAYLLASAYGGGIWYFCRVAVVGRWHEVRHGFPAVTLFAGALLIATLLHLDRFSSNAAFVVWIVLYASTPFAVAVVAIVQAPRDPRSDPRRPIARGPRVVLALIGLAAFAAGAAVFLFPEAAIPWWGWELTPLTAQVTGAVLSLTGVVNVAMLWDARPGAFRILFQAQLVSLAAIAASLVIRRDDLLWERPAAASFVMLVAVALLAYGITYVRLLRERAAPVTRA